MKITIDNYEAWLLDHLEGRLNETQTALLMRFMAEHPELEVAADDDLPVVEPFYTGLENGFANLKQPADAVVSVAGFNASNYDEAFAAYHEGDLDENSQANLHRFVALNPSLSPDFNLYGQLKLKPENILFPHKASLRRQRTLPLFVRWAVTAAAAAAVALLLVYKSGTDQQITTPEQNERAIVSSAMPKVTQKPTTEMADNPDKTTPATSKKTTIHPKPEAAQLTQRTASASVAKLKPIQAIAISSHSGQKRDIVEGSRYYTCLYTDIRLRDQLRFRQEMEAQGSQTIYGDAKEGISGKRFDLWALARIGVKGFNLITNSDVEFTKARNKEGKVTDFAIGGETLRVVHSSK